VGEVAALQETMTEKGITAKHLLVATTQGAVLDLPVHMVDPRRYNNFVLNSKLANAIYRTHKYDL
jgi:hypothetical protein